MKEILFLSVEQVCAIQKSLLPTAPSSNLGLIEGAINRVINQNYYIGTSDVFELAALYLIAIAKAHAFPDANKRTALESALVFLQLNEIPLTGNQALVEIAIKAAEGTTTIQEISELFRSLGSPQK